jgi:hypothetical protein
MDQPDSDDMVRRLADENARLKATLHEVHSTIVSVLGERTAAPSRPFEQQLLHDLRNVLNELNLLRALVPDEGPGKQRSLTPFSGKHNNA